MEFVCPWADFDNLPNNELKFLRSHGHTEKQALVYIKAVRKGKSCYVPRVWVYPNLVESHFQIEFREN